ncbi:unnamed protein product [Orchesella dallaii]|uniref:Lipase domain-containing protein n=1 Tax=Orchesella dallaii TaxID=48710 RepID=A0ABP1QTL2_9HEXA
MDYGQTSGNKIQIICHSMGCAVANFISQVTEEKIGRITGLDPAQPSFESGDPSEQLDASFVDIIHKNAGYLYEMKLGMFNDCGYVDFRPNGGRSQPGSQNELYGTCSNSRAIEYYLESVKDPDAFESFESHSYEEFERGVFNKQKPTKMGFWASNT